MTESIADTYWPEPRGTYEARRQRYLAFSAAQSPGGRTGFFSQIARLELGQPVNEGPIREGIAFVDSRQDCCDFAVAGLLRILYKYDASPDIAPSLITEIEACLLRFKYWWDEPQGDNRRCYHTENHQIIFHADELLAGQRFKDRVFLNNGEDGRAHIAHALHYIRRWLDFRARFGFSEWLSNCYFEEDLLALVNLYDFAEDAEIRSRAGALIDVILFEMALHTYRGVFGSTHGRTYTRFIKGGRHEGSAPTAKLMFGMGLFNSPNSLGTMQLATSAYRCPPLIAAIAADLDAPLLVKERHSFDIDDAPAWGLSYESMEDGHLFWSVQDYTHPRIYDLAQQTRQLRSIMLYEDYQPRYDQIFQWQVDEFGEVVDRDVDCHAMTEVHIQSYRTPDYLLSCAQDYRPGKPGYQQHPWQATLGIDAMVFTNHPGADDEISRPNFWAGNGILPRVAQHLNVAVVIHHLPATDAFPYSHAHFPVGAFDDVVERGHWVFGRKDDGYIALYSQHPARWLADRFPDPGAAPANIELRAGAPDNVWVCEMGRQADWGSFHAFVDAVAASEVQCDGLSVHYASPSLGAVAFSWTGPLTVAGQEVALRGTPRFDNPYCRAAFGDTRVTIRRGEVSLDLDLGVPA